MTAQQTIAIDIDDVIADSTESLRLLVNERAGVNLTRDDYFNVGGDYHRYYERVWMTHEIADKVTYNEYEAEMIADQSQVPLLPGAEFAIHELAKRFHIIFITARNKTWEKETRRWFSSHFGKNEVELYFCEKYVDVTAKTKGQLCKEFGAAWLVDDNVDHCLSALNEGVGAVLFGTYGWHRQTPSSIVRCADWPAVLEFFGNVDK